MIAKDVASRVEGNRLDFSYRDDVDHPEPSDLRHHFRHGQFNVTGVGCLLSCRDWYQHSRCNASAAQFSRALEHEVVGVKVLDQDGVAWRSIGVAHETAGDCDG